MADKIEVALFDFDKTLIPKSSGTFLVEYFLKLRLISRGFALRLLFIQIGYRFGVVDIHSVMIKTIAIVDGMSRKQLDEVLLDIYQSKLKFMLHAEAKKAIDLHKKAGRKVVIVSNNLSLMLTSTMQDWGIDQVIANELRYDGSRVVAEYAKEICYGHGKINRLKDLAYYSDIDFEKSYFYSDSFYDIPLLEFVGNPVVINADIKLARWAKRKKVEKYTWN